MKRRHLLFLIILTLEACTQTYSIYSNKYPVSFSCDISMPPFNSIQSLGYFITVRQRPAKDGYTVYTNTGMAYEFPLTEVQSRIFSYGLAGLIIGSPILAEGEIYAYDLGCPQCDRSSVRLTVNTTSYAKCAKCDTSYELNNNGYASNGGHPLYRYPITLNGSKLMVHN